MFESMKYHVAIVSVLRDKEHIILPPEAVCCVFVNELFLFTENCSPIFSDFFLKLLLKLLDRDLTISDKTIMLISVYLFVFCRLILFVNTLMVSLNASINLRQQHQYDCNINIKLINRNTINLENVIGSCLSIMFYTNCRNEQLYY